MGDVGQRDGNCDACERPLRCSVCNKALCRWLEAERRCDVSGYYRLGAGITCTSCHDTKRPPKPEDN